MADVWNKIKNIVGTSAPLLGNAILPGVGGTAGAILAKMLGCDPNDPKKIEEQLKADPQIALKLKELEQQHEEFLIKSSYESDKLYLNDIKDARLREVEYTKATGKLNWPMYILGGLVVLCFFLTIFCLFRIELIAFNKELIIYTVGGLQSAFITIIAYFYGSSKGSNDKNNMLSRMKEIKIE